MTGSATGNGATERVLRQETENVFGPVFAVGGLDDVDADLAGSGDVLGAVIDEKDLGRRHLLGLKHKAIYSFIRLHDLQFITEVHAVKIFIKRVAVAVKLFAQSPFDDERIGVGKEGKAVAFGAQFPEKLKIPLRNGRKESHVGVAALIHAHFPSDLLADTDPELLLVYQASLEIAKEPLLADHVQIFLYILKSQRLELVYHNTEIRRSDHPAEIKNNIRDVFSHIPKI